MQTKAKDQQNAENTIFDLRKKADLELQAGNTEAFQRIQTTIADLQKTTGAVTGRGKDTDNAGIDY
jgi:HPt (histidine-containing phosphotransfer) domain-containing protein